MNATKLTGLFERRTKEGETFLAGKLSPFARLLVLKNRYKRNDRDPDYYAFLAPRSRGPRDEPKEPTE